MDDLAPGSQIGTSSVRRTAQLSRSHPHLKCIDVRGNLNTRLSKLDDPNGPYAALVLATAGMQRLGWSARISHPLGPEVMMHAVGQGALGIEVCARDTEALRVCAVLNHPDSQLRCWAERGYMRALEGGCSVPLGVWTEITTVARDSQAVGTRETGRDAAVDVQRLEIRGNVTSPDGTEQVEGHFVALLDAPDLAGRLRQAEAAGVSLAEIVVHKGARKILDAIVRVA